MQMMCYAELPFIWIDQQAAPRHVHGAEIWENSLHNETLSFIDLFSNPHNYFNPFLSEHSVHTSQPSTAVLTETSTGSDLNAPP